MKRLLAAAGVIGFATGCLKGPSIVDAGTPDAGPQVVTEREPNDRPEQAMAIAESTIVSASLSVDPKGPDEDWYLLSASSSKVVDVSVSGIPGGDVMFELYDVDKNLILTVNSEGEGKPERIPNLIVKSKLLLKVTSARRGSGGAYTLTCLFSEPAPGFEVEPNDRAADATPLLLGQTISGFIGHAADEDWYVLDLLAQTDGGIWDAGPSQPSPSATGPDGGAGDGGLSDGGEGDGGQAFDGGMSASAPPSGPPNLALRIRLTGVDGVRPEIQVLSAAQALLFRGEAAAEGEGLSLRNIGVRANDRMVYLVVKAVPTGSGKAIRRGANPDKPYTLLVTPEEAGANAELEPNDSAEKATPLPAEGYREGFLYPKGDIDYYVLTPERPSIVQATLSGVERLDLTLSAIAPSANEGEREQILLEVNDGLLKEPEILSNYYCEKQCWFKVQGALRKVDGKKLNDFENPDQPYRLTVTSSPDDGSIEHEPNNSWPTATPISLGHPMRGTIQPKRDVDYFRLDLSGRPVRTAIKATATGILKVKIGLYLYRMGEDGKLILEQAAERAKGEAPEIIRYSAPPGVYYLLVRDVKMRESNFQDYYQLSIEEDG